MAISARSMERGNSRFTAVVFLIFGLFFAGASIREIVTLPGGDLPDASTITATLWMMPILILSVTFFTGFAMLNRFANGSLLVRANVSAIAWISVGMVLAGAWEGIARIAFEQAMPEMLTYGGKQHLLLTAFIAIGSMLGLLSHAMKTAVDLKEEHDHIL